MIEINTLNVKINMGMELDITVTTMYLNLS